MRGCGPAVWQVQASASRRRQSADWGDWAGADREEAQSGAARAGTGGGSGAGGCEGATPGHEGPVFWVSRSTTYCSRHCQVGHPIARLASRSSFYCSPRHHVSRAIARLASRSGFHCSPRHHVSRPIARLVDRSGSTCSRPAHDRRNRTRHAQVGGLPFMKLRDVILRGACSVCILILACPHMVVEVHPGISGQGGTHDAAQVRHADPTDSTERDSHLSNQSHIRIWSTWGMDEAAASPPQPRHPC